MNLDLTFFQNPAIIQTVRLFALVISLGHLLWGVVTYRQLISASRMINTNGVNKLKFVTIVQLVILTVILLLVIFY